MCSHLIFGYTFSSSTPRPSRSTVRFIFFSFAMHLCRLIRILTRPRTAAAAFCSPSSPSPSAPAADATDGAVGLLKIGDVLRGSRQFSAEDVTAYAEVSGDRNPIHLDGDFAQSVAGFGGCRVVHGMLVASLFPSVIASHFPGAIYVSQTLHFKLPVYIGDEVVAEVQTINLRENKKRYIVKFTTRCITNRECLALEGEATAILPTLVLNR